MRNSYGSGTVSHVANAGGGGLGRLTIYLPKEELIHAATLLCTPQLANPAALGMKPGNG